MPDHNQGNDFNDPLPRLNVLSITAALLAKPDESNRSRGRAGRHVDSGANFGIVELPMFAIRESGDLVAPTAVTVYFDDRGWVVAYLKADEPAAAIWRYDTGPTDSINTDQSGLENNLLVLAINEVLDAARDDIPAVAMATHDTVAYYHWQHPACNAFLLFAHGSSGGTSEPARFVVPPTIRDIHASAGVLVTSTHSPDEADTKAQLAIDGEAVVTAQKPTPLAMSKFELKRTEDATDLYEVTVTAEEGETASGVVMLLYRKPGT